MIMEDRRFDTVTKAFASGTTRRRVLRGLLAGAGSGALISLTRHNAVAAACDFNCTGGDQCCPGRGCFNPDVNKCFHCGQAGNRIGTKGDSHKNTCG
jgi:hypothetical protein